MREAILKILNDMGIQIESRENNDDFDLSELFLDSIQFISFIVDVEDYLQTSLPEEYLLIEKFRSFNALCDAWEYYVSKID
jgi:acyl carrier protein